MDTPEIIPACQPSLITDRIGFSQVLQDGAIMQNNRLEGGPLELLAVSHLNTDASPAPLTDPDFKGKWRAAIKASRQPGPALIPMDVNAQQAGGFFHACINDAQLRNFTGATVLSSGNVVTAQVDGNTAAAILTYDPQTGRSKLRRLTNRSGETSSEDARIEEHDCALIREQYEQGARSFLLVLTENTGADTNASQLYEEAASKFFADRASALEASIAKASGREAMLRKEDASGLPTALASALTNAYPKWHPHTNNLSIAVTEIVPDRPIVIAAFNGQNGEHAKADHAQCAFDRYIGAAQEYGIESATRKITRGQIKPANVVETAPEEQTRTGTSTSNTANVSTTSLRPARAYREISMSPSSSPATTQSLNPRSPSSPDYKGPGSAKIR